jgi:hypothetical protein
MNLWYEQQTLEYCINWDIPTPYVGATSVEFIHMNGKFKMENSNHLFCYKIAFLTVPPCQCVGQGMK